MEMAIQAILEKREDEKKNKARVIANRKLSDFISYCRRYGLRIRTPKLEGAYHAMYTDISEEIEIL
jgi:hypothetical protein